MVANRRSSGTASGRRTVTFRAPAVAAFARARSSTRSLTSTPQTSASGACSAMAMLSGPHPQPTSRSAPVAGGGGTLCSNTRVPASSRSGLKTPAAVARVSVRPARVTVMRRGRASLSGWAEK